MENKSVNVKKNKKKDENVLVLDNFVRVKLSQSLLKFSGLYDNKKVWFKILLIFIVSLLTGFFGVILLQNTGLYNVGLEALSQGIGRLAQFLVMKQTHDPQAAYNVFNALFWSIIILVNIPLIFFGWFKISKKFSLYTTLYIIISSCFGMGLGFIPQLQNLFIFAKIDSHAVFSSYGVQFVTWNLDSDNGKQLSLFIYGFFFGTISSIFYTILFIINASTGGLDFIVVWYAEKKYRDIGTIFTYVNIVFFIISYTIGTYIPAGLAFQTAIDTNAGNTQELLKTMTPFSVDTFFSPSFFASIIMSIVLGTFLNRLFPKYQMCKVEINSKEVEKLRELIILQKKPYAISIYNIEGGYSKQPHKVLTTNCMYMDAAKLLKFTRKIDPNALYIVTILKTYDGYAYFRTKENEQINIKKWLSIWKKEKHEDEMNEPHEIKIGVDEKNISIVESKINGNEVSDVPKNNNDDENIINKINKNDAENQTTFIVGNEIIDEKLNESHNKTKLEFAKTMKLELEKYIEEEEKETTKKDKKKR